MLVKGGAVVGKIDVLSVSRAFVLCIILLAIFIFVTRNVGSV